jgi:hypothetical protein
LLGVVLLVNVPLFLCQGLTSDVCQWDLCTRTVLHGGVLYRDALENNFPGMFWLQALVRSALGWRPEALRAADLLMIGAAVWMLVRQLPSRQLASRLALAAVLLLFYFSTAEWCHCQRDPWLLLPALLALRLRQRQVLLLADASNSSRSLLPGAFLEGALWGTAFWLKPFVALPAVVCWLLSVPGVRRWRVLIDGAAWVAGGLASGAAGIAWLWASGTWPAFVEVVLGWNREYVVNRMVTTDLATLVLGFLVRLFPWVLVHLAAVPLALVHVGRRFRKPTGVPLKETTAHGLLSGL